MKIRALDGCINPYIVFALLIHAGLDGVEQKLPLGPACDVNLFTAPAEVVSRYDAVPASLCEAIRLAQQSRFIDAHLTARTLEGFFSAKQVEHDRIAAARNRPAAEHEMYFARY